MDSSVTSSEALVKHVQDLYISAPSANASQEDKNTSVACVPVPPPKVYFNEWNQPRLSTFCPKFICAMCLQLKQMFFPDEKGNVSSNYLILEVPKDPKCEFAMNTVVITRCCDEIICNECRPRINQNLLKKSNRMVPLGHYEWIVKKCCQWHKKKNY